MPEWNRFVRLVFQTSTVQRIPCIQLPKSQCLATLIEGIKALAQSKDVFSRSQATSQIEAFHSAVTIFVHKEITLSETPESSPLSLGEEIDTPIPMQFDTGG